MVPGARRKQGGDNYSECNRGRGRYLTGRNVKNMNELNGAP